MVAVYGNLMVMVIAITLFFATVNLGKRPCAPPGKDAESSEPASTPQGQA